MNLFIRIPVVSNDANLPIISQSEIKSLSYLLDVYIGSVCAFGLRLLKRTYAGSSIRVRRSSDNAELDIGFLNDALDTASLLAFVGSGDGFVTIWYDQSGNGNNVAQTTGDFQPKIVIAGSLATLNKKPTISFNGTNNRLKFNNLNVFRNVAYAYILSVLKSNITSGNTAALIFSTPTGSARFGISQGDEQGGRINTMFRIADTPVASVKAKSLVDHSASARLFEAYALPSEGLLKAYQDTVLQEVESLGSSANSPNTASADALIGANPNGSASSDDANFWNGSISEVIIYTKKMDEIRSQLASDVYSNFF